MEFHITVLPTAPLPLLSAEARGGLPTFILTDSSPGRSLTPYTGQNMVAEVSAKYLPGSAMILTPGVEYERMQGQGFGNSIDIPEYMGAWIRAENLPPPTCIGREFCLQCTVDGPGCIPKDDVAMLIKVPEGDERTFHVSSWI